MKISSILLAGAVAALPLVASAQDPNAPQERRSSQSTTTTTEEATNESKAATVITGKVQSYEAGHSITLLNDKGDASTYVLTDATTAPKGLEVGKTVTIRTTTVSGSPVVKMITTTTTTTTKESRKKTY